jgi:hypothetical protein
VQRQRRSWWPSTSRWVCFISFAGTVCRPEARKVHAAARAVSPAERLLARDGRPGPHACPDLPRRNEPAALLADRPARVAALRDELGRADVLARSAAACADTCSEPFDSVAAEASAPVGPRSHPSTPPSLRGRP